MGVERSPIRTLDPPAFRRALLSWYRTHGRDLPWRRTRDPYAILVSELMLQQTQVATVLSYYREWLRRFPDFATLAAASDSDVLHAWQGLGYYARTRNLHATARAVVAQLGGRFPASPEQSRRLPGIGRYTANAIATFAFDATVPVVEANTARLLARLTNFQERIDTSAGAEQLWQVAGTLVPRSNAGRYNSALMDLGATICVSGTPKCGICPVRNFCRAENPAMLPRKSARAALKRLTEHHSFAVQNGRVLLQQSQERWRGMWILPRLKNAPARRRPLHSADFPFTHHRIKLVVFATRAPVTTAPDHRWFRIAELDTIPLPSPHRRAVASVLAARHSDPASTSRRMPRKVLPCDR